MEGPEVETTGENDVHVEGSPQQQQQNVLQNSTPLFLQNCFYLVVGIVERYGWFIVLGLIILAFVWHKFKPQLMRILKKWEQHQEMKKYDPVKAAELQARIDESRRRWQEQLDAKAARFEEEKKKKEDEKRKEMIEDWERHQEGKGYRSKKFKKADDDTSLAQSLLKPKKKKPLRDTDYHPLSGGGGSGSSYRPPRRGGGG
ncbi:selenoprotein S-like [Actinia tenebrosa]|uniref:Selenoprotein S-like n=1 Tax=Actinia tenebrosa TaxID=6105 RepID=A0A6P8IU99_ACTTE|nr:selenoprotein S-like [Actinia tenebrosa]